MTTLAWALPLVLVGTWVAATGCDDTRPVGDLPADGGEPGATGGSGTSGGEPSATGGSGIAGGAGEGGGSGAPECPADLFTAEGEDCEAFGEGFICSDGGTDPCEFGNSIRCVAGIWERQEAFPAPCGGAGGGGAGGASGGAGADAMAGAGGSG